MNRYIFLDLETKQALDEQTNVSANELDISISVTYDYKAGYRAWMERDSTHLINYLITFDYVIGFNLINFDYEVLSQYDYDDLLSDLEDKTIDLLFLIELEIGKRISLKSLAAETLAIGKIENGLEAIEYWQKRKIQKLIDYCKEDVRITRLLFEFIQRNGFLYYSSSGIKTKINLSIPKDARSVQLDLHEYKIWFDIFMESLMLSESISTKQISILKDKTNSLIDSFESKLDEFEAIFGSNSPGTYKKNDDDYYNDDCEEEEDEDEDEEEFSPYRKNNAYPDSDDLPF